MDINTQIHTSTALSVRIDVEPKAWNKRRPKDSQTLKNIQHQIAKRKRTDGNHGECRVAADIRRTVLR